MHAVLKRIPIAAAVLVVAALTGWWLLPLLAAVAVLATGSEAYLSCRRLDALQVENEGLRRAQPTPLREAPIPSPPVVIGRPPEGVRLLAFAGHGAVRPVTPPAEPPNEPADRVLGVVCWLISHTPRPLLMPVALFLARVDRAAPAPANGAGLDDDAVEVIPAPDLPDAHPRHASDDEAEDRPDYPPARHANEHLPEGWPSPAKWDEAARAFFVAESVEASR